MERDNAVLSLVRRTVDLADELARHPRLTIALDRDFGLMLVPHNEAGVVATRIIQMWLGVEAPSIIRVGDSLTIHRERPYPPTHYPLFDDGDEGATGGDRQDSQRARSPIEGAGTSSPTTWPQEAWAWETAEESTA
jgi:hypothetical protein